MSTHSKWAVSLKPRTKENEKICGKINFCRDGIGHFEIIFKMTERDICGPKKRLNNKLRNLATKNSTVCWEQLILNFHLIFHSSFTMCLLTLFASLSLRFQSVIKCSLVWRSRNLQVDEDRNFLCTHEVSAKPVQWCPSRVLCVKWICSSLRPIAASPLSTIAPVLQPIVG